MGPNSHQERKSKEGREDQWNTMGLSFQWWVRESGLKNSYLGHCDVHRGVRVVGGGLVGTRSAPRSLSGKWGRGANPFPSPHSPAQGSRSEGHKGGTWGTPPPQSEHPFLDELRWRDTERDRGTKAEGQRHLVMPGGLARVGMLGKQRVASCVSRRIKIRAPTQLGVFPKGMSAAATVHGQPGNP